MSTYLKSIIGLTILLFCCMLSYFAGWGAGHNDALKPQREAAKQQEELPATPKQNYLMSADMFIPNFNANANTFYLVDYRPVQDDFIEFGSTSQDLIIIGKGDTNKLGSIGIIFPKNNMKAYDEAIEGIQAAILALSPSTNGQDCRYIMEQLGLLENINKADGMKISEHHGIRYAATYEAYRVNFMAMPAPAN